MNRLAVATLLAVAAMGATAGSGFASKPSVLVEGKGVAAVPAAAGLTEDARAQQAIDAATAAALIGALQSRFEGYDVQVRLGNVETARVSVRDMSLHGDGSIKLGSNEAWLPIRFDALYDTSEQVVLSPNIVLGRSSAATQSAKTLPLDALQARVDKAIANEYASNRVDFSLAGARIVGDDGVRLVVQGDGVASFDGERIPVTLQALYDRSTKRWVDPQYALVEG